MDQNANNSHHFHFIECYTSLYELRAQNIYLPRTRRHFERRRWTKHIGLYQGYVKNFNAIFGRDRGTYAKDHDKNTHAISELIRRRSFEFDGMRFLHEHYFAQFEGGAKALA